MTRKEMLAYVLVAIVGGVTAGLIDGVPGLLAVFTGLGTVGFVDLLVHLR